MLGTNELFVGAPFITRAAVGAAFWLLSVLILMLHRSGAQIVGMLFVLSGSLGLVAGVNPHIALLLVLFGFIVHSLGRVLHWMRHR
ncbi:MAG: hypothetical protein ABIH23_27615 [bacterium]